jgi:hypothetical protein
LGSALSHFFFFRRQDKQTLSARDVGLSAFKGGKVEAMAADQKLNS